MVASLLREPARPAVIREHPLAPWFAVVAVCFGAFMGQLDASVVTVAFPALQRQFGAGLASVQWVSLAYLLVLTALLVPAGRWSDRAGRKLMYLYGFVVFAGSSAACGLAPSLGVLIALRVVQAGGAALLQANSVALVVTSVPERNRRAALGVQAAAQAVGLASGPVVGGLLVAAAGWRWVFLLNVPVGVLAVVAGVCLLPRTRGAAGQLLAGQPPAARPPVDKHRTDPGGTVLLATATTAGMLAISALSGLGTPGWTAAVLAAVAVLTGTALLRHERRVAAPLLDLRTMAASGTGSALLGALCAYLVLFGPLVLFPQVVSAQGGSAESAGLLLTALPAGFGLAAVVADKLVPAGWQNRRRCLLGGAVMAASAAALAVPAPHAVSVVLLGLLGIGLGIYTPANNAEIMAAVPARDAAAAGGMVNMTRGTGTALGVAVVTLGLHAGALLRSPHAGLALSMAALAAVALLGTGAALRARPAADGLR
ncbi:MAG: Major facilitator superfamily 1 [Actinomycetia bacterium]|nr:Major facilitator superfamily 1 [Actinomycetes bacterium]